MFKKHGVRATLFFFDRDGTKTQLLLALFIIHYVSDYAQHSTKQNDLSWSAHAAF